MKVLGSFRAPSIAYPGEIREISFVKFDSMVDKCRYIRSQIDTYGMDPRIRELAAEILRRASVRPRDYEHQAEALLSHVQSLYYLWEGVETIQSPIYTLSKGYSDCDCLVAALGALYRSIDLPTCLEIIGPRKMGRPVWQHIYLRVGIPPKRDTRWLAAETTIKLPLGEEPWTVMERIMDRRKQLERGQSEAN